MVNGRSTVHSLTTTLLPDLLIPVKDIHIQKISVSDIQIFGLSLNPLTADNKYSLLKRRNLFEHFQMQLSQKRKIFSQFFLAFSKFRFNFEHFQKKDDPHR